MQVHESVKTMPYVTAEKMVANIWIWTNRSRPGQRGFGRSLEMGVRSSMVPPVRSDKVSSFEPTASTLW